MAGDRIGVFECPGSSVGRWERDAAVVGHGERYRVGADRGDAAARSVGNRKAAVVAAADDDVSDDIQGAMNIDVEASTFDSEIAKLDKTKTYAVYCHSGNRSGVATQAMAKAGFTHLFNLQNGIADWMGQGMPTVMN